MKFLTLLCTLSALFVPALLKGSGEGEAPGRYIITLKPTVEVSSVLSNVTYVCGNKGVNITYTYNATLNGFAGTFDHKALSALKSMPGVASIVDDTPVNATATQTDAPWGLARINSQRRLGSASSSLTYTYNYNDAAGTGVDIYVIVGRQFLGPRSHTESLYLQIPAFVLPTTSVTTLCVPRINRTNLEVVLTGQLHSGLILTKTDMVTAHTAPVGTRYGVAKRAEVFAIKALSDAGPGWTSDVIAGMDFALTAARTSGRPTVISMSLEGGVNTAMDEAARTLVCNGLHVVVAAGNGNQDAVNVSPARVREVITVGGTTILDERRFDSNFGPRVDVFGPGDNVISAGIASDVATATLSGTSMATPHVAGLIAYLISVEGNMLPSDMKARIQELSLKGLINPYTLPEGTVNKIAANGFMMQT
ncbi:hypothetical protein NMY22_g4394 [Coprinellus aureogranulatus]|nr:hypothetical protein NMY22_g4394 [Coprinellus aureogranulatus]